MYQSQSEEKQIDDDDVYLSASIGHANLNVRSS